MRTGNLYIAGLSIAGLAAQVPRRWPIAEVLERPGR